MNDLFMLPPLTASYSDNLGPKVTIAYEEVIRSAYKSPNLFVPWNSGGRKFEWNMKGNYDILMQEIEECKHKYINEKILPKDFFEAIFPNLKDIEDFLESMEDKFRITEKQVFYITEDIKRECFMEDYGTGV